MAETRGIDLSHWQGYPDFAAVKAAGYDFVILKATEGINVIDASFNTNAQRANIAGLLVMSYHFAHPGQSSGAAQGEFHLRVVKGCGAPVVGVWLDIEVSDGDGRSQVWTFCGDLLGAFRAGFHGKVGAYCGQSWASEYGSVLFANGDGAWIADPGYHPGVTFNIWQNSWVDRVPGISGNVDEDMYEGTLGEFRAWLGLDIPAPPVVTPPAKPEPVAGPQGTPFYPLADVVPVFVGAAAGRIAGDLGKAVVINTALASLGYHNGQMMDVNHITPHSVDAYAAYQRHKGYTGAAANGIPGHITFRELARESAAFRTD